MTEFLWNYAGVIALYYLYLLSTSSALRHADVDLWNPHTRLDAPRTTARFIFPVPTTSSPSTLSPIRERSKGASKKGERFHASVHQSAQDPDVFPQSSAIPMTKVLSRVMLQTGIRDSACSLSLDLVAEIRNEQERMWLMDAVALERIEGDVQLVMDCIQEGDTVLFNIDHPIQLMNRIEITQNVTLGTFSMDGQLRRTRFRCPPNEGAFLVRSPGVIFENITFAECNLDAGQQAALIEIEPCLLNTIAGAIRLRHITFRRNRLNGVAALKVTQPSCASVEMTDVAFMANRCSGVCFANLALENTLLRVKMARNRKLERESAFTLLSLPSGSETTVVDMHVHRNSGRAVINDEAVLKVARSNFSDNDGRSVIVLEKAGDVTITDTTFKRNRAVGRSGAVLRATSTPSIRIENSIFAENAATDGGAMALERSVVELVGCRFEDNHAENAGGALHLTNGSSFDMEETTFLKNDAVYGGALMVQNAEEQCLPCNPSELGNADPSCATLVSAPTSEALPFQESTEESVRCRAVLSLVDFKENHAEMSGGAVFLSNATMALQNTTLEGNTCTENGAGMLVTDAARLEMAGGAFRTNSGQSGSAIHATHGATVIMRDARVEECRSDASGGGVFLRDAFLTLHTVHFEGTRAGDLGGGIYCRADATVSGHNVTFHHSNASRSGGGIFATEHCHVEMNVSRFAQNEATVSGGGIALKRHATAVVHETTFSANNATKGGALWVKTSEAILTSSLFENNTAVAGGGSVAAQESDVTVMTSTFRGDVSQSNGGSFDIRNKTLLNISGTDVLSGSAPRGNGSGIYLVESDLVADDLRMHKGYALKYGGAIFAVNSTIQCNGCHFEENRVVRDGGALFLIAPASLRIPYRFKRCVFKNNTAGSGGAISYEDATSDDSCFDSAENCAFIHLEATHFVDNHVRSAGGAIYKASKRYVRYTCEDQLDDDIPVTRVLSSTNDTCREWRGNSALAFGPFIASAFTRYQYFMENRKTGELEAWNDRVRYLERHKSGDPLPTIAIEVIDEFDQSPVYGVKDDPELIIFSSNDFMTGEIHVQVSDGAVNITGIAALQLPRNYDVILKLNDSGEEDMRIINVHVRNCSVGEVMTMNGTFCAPCAATQCNFNPEGQCQPCPEHADCSSGNVVHPVAGYWHRHPCSEDIRQCITEEACQYTDRKKQLVDVTDDILTCDCANKSLTAQYGTALCREGYEGPLCGSCADTHGRFASMKCSECHSRYGYIILCVLFFLLLLLLSSLAMRGNLLITKPVGIRRSQRISFRQTTDDPQTDSEDVECPSPGDTGSNNPPADTVDPACNAQALKQCLIEVFKMTLNFLQVVAIAVSINVDWTSALMTLFNVSDFMGGAGMSSVGFPIDCILPADTGVGRSIIRTVLLIGIPLILSSLFIIFWTSATLYFAETWSYFTKRLLLSLLVVAYISYQFITKAAVDVLSCIRVEESCTDSMEPSTVLRDVSIYWSIDTSIRCYEGSHTILAGTLGWPTVTLFSMGFPITMALVLIHSKPENRESNIWMREASGFLYRAYREKLVFWESIVLLRKALLVMTASFGPAFAGHVQGILAVCIMTAALFLHMFFRPFKSELNRFNSLESGSLIVGQLTFVCGLFLNDADLSNGVRWTLGFLLFMMIGGLLSLLFREWYILFATYARIVLKIAGIEDLDSRGHTRVLIAYVAFRVNHLYDYMKKGQNRKSRSANIQCTIA